MRLWRLRTSGKSKARTTEDLVVAISKREEERMTSVTWESSRELRICTKIMLHQTSLSVLLLSQL